MASEAHAEEAVKVVDALPQAEVLLDAGIQHFSEVLISAISSQVDGTTAELKALDKLNHVATAKYAELQDNLSEVAAFQEGVQQLLAAVKPQLEQIDALEAAVKELEEVANNLDVHARTLEMAFQEVLSSQ